MKYNDYIVKTICTITNVKHFTKTLLIYDITTWMPSQQLYQLTRFTGDQMDTACTITNIEHWKKVHC